MRTAWPSGSATVLLSFAVAVAACAPTTADTGPAVDAADCNKGVLDTLYPGIFTFGADQPVYPPWYKGDDPANGEGFESALAYAVAATLQYGADDVRWVRVPFNAALTPGPKSFDVNLSQFSITDQRRVAVDFSSPYFDVTQAVVTTQGSPAAGVTTLEDLRSHRLGTQVDTTGHTVATTLLDDGAVQTYQTIVDAKMALLDGEIDAMVLDLPTALAMAGELRDGVLLGQLPSTGDEVEQFGIVLAYESPLTRCVSWAVDSLRADGALVRLQNRWLTDTGSVAVLR